MTLEQEMRQLLARMSLVQYGSVTAWAPTGREVAGSRPPTGSSRPLVDEWRERWARDPSRDTIEEAREALESWVKRTAPQKPQKGTESDWILEDGKGFTPEEVARRFNTTPSRVRRLRVDHGVDPELGETRVLHVPASASKEARVIMLTEQGLSSREVAVQVGLHKTQVLRILARSKKAA